VTDGFWVLIAQGAIVTILKTMAAPPLPHPATIHQHQPPKKLVLSRRPRLPELPRTKKL
jgi:hypothetical protein